MCEKKAFSFERRLLSALSVCVTDDGENFAKKKKSSIISDRDFYWVCNKSIFLAFFTPCPEINPFTRIFQSVGRPPIDGQSVGRSVMSAHTFSLQVAVGRPTS